MSIKEKLFEKLCLSVFLFVILSSLQFSPGNPLIPNGDIIQLALLLVVFFISLLSLRKGLKKISFFQGLSFVLLLLLFAWSLITVTQVENYYLDSFRRCVLVFGVALLVFLSFMFFRPSFELIFDIAVAIMVAGTAVSLIGLVMSFFGSEYQILGGGLAYQYINLGPLTFAHEIHLSGGMPRIASVTTNPNNLGFFATAACIVVAWLYLNKKVNLLSASLLFLLNFSALVHSMSRSNILALTLLLLLLSFVYFGRRIAIAYSFFCVFLFVAFFVFYEKIIQAVGRRIEQGSHGRDDKWNIALDSFYNNPLMGVGFGMEKELVMHAYGETSTIHNVYLVMLVEIGIVGFVLFCAFVLFSIAGGGMKMRTLASGNDINLKLLCFCLIGLLMIRGVFSTAFFRFSDTGVMFFFLLFLLLFSERYRAIGTKR